MPRATAEAPQRSGSSAAPAPRPHFTLGTAGHVDHGKTALVAALTGVDTDRLPEEKARGITIDLGFAALDLANGTRLSVVDVPGHERLIRNMVAGATGIDRVLLVAAADEGVMPQTREHLAICELLGLRRGLVALTKIDLVEPELIELARDEIRSLLAPGPLAELPIVAVSARSGAGLEALRAALAALTEEAGDAPGGDEPPRLWIDRVFSMRGFGPVVTGTLAGGSLARGDSVVLQPSGTRARVRGLESHGVAASHAPPGARVAVNLQGVALAALHRGQLLTLPDRGALISRFDAALQWLDAAPPLRRATSAELLIGTAERRARLDPIGVPLLEPGGRGFARIHILGPPLPLLAGDRFILRGFARNAEGGTTMGGGAVVEIAPPRRRSLGPPWAAELAILEGSDPGERLRRRVERAGLAGVELPQLAREAGLSPERGEQRVRQLEAEGTLLRGDGGLCLAATAVHDIETRIAAALHAFHQREPLRPGLSPAALPGELPDNVRAEAVGLALERLVAAQRVVVADGLARLSAHRIHLSPSDEARVAELAAGLRDAGLEPPGLREWAERLELPQQRIRELLTHLTRCDRAVQAPGAWFFDATAVETLRQRVRHTLRAQGELSTADYKTLIGTTRRHAVPLMELLDAERLTLRVGEKRILRRGGTP